MTYKFIKEVSGRVVYFVSTQEEVDSHPNINCVIGGDAEIAAKLLENQQIYLQQDGYLFHCNKEIVEGNNTTWLAADFDNDPEDTVYQVFNPFTGVHELIAGRLEAKTRLDKLKQDSIASKGLDKPFEVEFLPEPIKQPVSSNIPVAGL